jgi:hypothetical protein
MIVDKEIVSKILKDYIFITGGFDIDPKYFKKRIDEGVKKSNLNYATNVVGNHTSWTFFNKDEKFGILLLQMIDHLESLNIDLERFNLVDSWGIIEKFGEYTKRHHHNPMYLSGILYLNDHSQKLYFPDIKQEITPKRGRFALFSSFLSHYTKRNLEHHAKYAISFNFKNGVVGEKF